MEPRVVEFVDLIASGSGLLGILMAVTLGLELVRFAVRLVTGRL